MAQQHLPRRAWVALLSTILIAACGPSATRSAAPEPVSAQAQTAEMYETLVEDMAAGRAPSGSLPRAAIHRVIVGGAVEGVRACWNAALAREPRLRVGGRLVSRFVIAPDGRVAVVDIIDDEAGDADLANCIAAVMHALTFPPPTGGGFVRVTYPWILSVSDGARTRHPSRGTRVPPLGHRLRTTRVVGSRGA